jgi:hypothetical protein
VTSYNVTFDPSIEAQYQRGAKLLGMTWDEITNIFGSTPQEREKLLPEFERLVFSRYTPAKSNRRKLVEHTKRKDKKNGQQKKSRRRNR